MSKEYIQYRMRCAGKEGKKCGYRYYVEIPIGYPTPTFETCPLCGHHEEFHSFVREQKKIRYD